MYLSATNYMKPVLATIVRDCQEAADVIYS